MATPEEIEKARQAIMRFRELLDIMSERVAEGERAYAQLFLNRSPEEMATLPEKELQGRAAVDLLGMPSNLSSPALHLRLVCRDLERDFEQVYDNIMTE